MQLPDAEELDRLKLSPEVAWYLLDRGHQLPDCPPAIKTPEPRQIPGAAFDPARVDRVLRAFGLLRHTQGEWAGMPLHPDVWQIAYVIAPVCGWVRRDEAGRWVRIIRTLYVDVPRKNGKSTLCQGIGLYMTCADGEAGAQVLCGATTKEQAGFIFEPIKLLATSAPKLKPHVRPYAARIVHPASGSYIKAISSVADAQHGGNIHCAIVDELHVHKTPDLVEALETGTGSRSQPLSVLITTADSGKPGTIYARKRHYIEQLARRVLHDETTYGVVWAAEKSDDPHDEATWRRANPGYGISPKASYLRAESNKAKGSPADLAKFLRLHLGIRTKQETRYFTLDSWDRNASIVDRERLAGRACFGGLDLASTSDLCALCWLFPDEDGGYDALWRLWTPEANLEALDARTAGEASVWQRCGWLTTTPGNVADYEVIRADLDVDMEFFDVRSLGYDPWNATPLTNALTTDGMPMVKVRQGFITLSPPTKELQRLLLAGTEERPLLRHSGLPPMRWMLDNVAVDMDAAGNVKPSKKNSAEKIDGVSALVIALSEAMNRPTEHRSAYAEEGSGLDVI